MYLAFMEELSWSNKVSLHELTSLNVYMINCRSPGLIDSGRPSAEKASVLPYNWLPNATAEAFLWKEVELAWPGCPDTRDIFGPT